MSYVQTLLPNGTNSTMFTTCCGCAICDDEKNCPKCNEPIIGSEVESDHERRMIRWNYATRFF